MPTDKQATGASPLWQTIVVPIDFSPASDSAFVYALKLAAMSGATVHACHVVPIPHVLDAMYERGFDPPETLKRIERKARQHIKTLFEANNQDSTVPLRIHFSEGQAAAGVLEWATKLKPDLIVIGTHGRTGTKRFLMGSVAEAVVRRAPCPVVTIKATS
ncbi:MAG: universal stress protein [Candidatus Binatia bacterium]